MPVLIGALARSSEIYSLGMGVPVKEISNTWRKGHGQAAEANEVKMPPARRS